MSANRDRERLFPAVSIGRNSGLATSDLLTAHPLLSPSSPNTPDPTQRIPSPVPRYVPYTPRQRSAPTAATTIGTTTHSSAVASAPQQQGGATSKLQLMNLKAEAQNIGLDTSSVGWAILEKLVGSDGGEWTDVWSALAVGKATLLLPLEPAASSDRITADFVKDHIVLCDGPSRKNAHIVTLSGLRGTLDGNTLTLRSTLHPSSKAFLDLLSPTTRPSTLAMLAPIPHLPTATSYPMFAVPTHAPALALPPRIPPPLPPRPVGSLSRGTGSQHSRLSNPFASLFGANHPPPIVPKPSPASIHEGMSSSDHPVNVPAFTIAQRIVRKDVARSIEKALRTEIHSISPPWVAERVDTFVNPWYPFKRVKRGSDTSSTSNNGSTNYVVGDPLAGMLPEEIGEMVQGFYARLEEDFTSRRKSSDEENADLDEKEKEELQQVLAQVERAISVLFFDRLFSPASSDDPSHDQALSSRVAALNMLDLNLEHLGVDVPADAQEGLDLVVQSCGQVLSGLELHQSPADKVSIMVQAHREVIEGLSRLPPIRLLSEEEERTRALARKAPPLVADPPPPSQESQSPSPAPVVPRSLEDGDESKSIDDVTSTEVPDEGPETKTEASTSEPTVEVDAQPTPTPVSSDVLLPLIIFAVVKSNPSRLVSHLLFSQRFRVTPSGIAQGEEAFCLVNLMAVAEFLENVDLEALGLGDSGISVADLTPIPIARNSPKAPSLTLGDDNTNVLRRQVDTLTEGAGRMLTGVTGVVDSSFGMLKQLLPNVPTPLGTPALDNTSSAAPWNLPHAVARPGFGLLRRETGFSIGGISIGGRSVEKREEELKDVSRPASLRGDAHSDEESDEEDEDEDEDEAFDGPSSYDTRSIRSFESMMSREKRKAARKPRKSLSDRLAHVSAGLAGFKGSPSRFDSSRPNSPAVRAGELLALAPPNPRFLDCAPDDLKLAEVAELLRDYRRLVDGIRAVGGFVGED
ncbi:unnamed protein product [Mycena citricolor]|uniref:VPS9 domain-containing protein n=1 Tax=Mycena citricolor TaxID=2018698 RepID=A0AAD2K1K6_9AGAR|nr:unnamed protein product [Mycena citricolor]